MRKVIFGAVLIGLVLFNSNCSVYMAANQPEEKDIDLFTVGTPRSLLLAEFGKPAVSETRDDGKKYEVFSFTQGYSDGAKAGRAILHGTADVLTLGLWEVVGTPSEAVFDGDQMAYEIRYDNNDVIDQVKALKKK